MSGTPRCDSLSDSGRAHYLSLSFARQLERELNAANEKVKRLEEAGDALCEHSAPTRSDLDALQQMKRHDVKRWQEAKEATR